MDNLTHSLIGAALGQAGLKRRTGLAMPTLIIAANIPDLDAACTIYGTGSLAMRRGLTHGPLAMLLLPLLLTAAMIMFDRWQTRAGKRPAQRLPIHRGWLLALAYIGTLSHPLFDWMNSYGIRLLEPFSSRWFYGDTLFIIDIWVLLLLIGGIWLSRRRERGGAARWTMPAQGALAGLLAYVLLNMTISARAIDWMRAAAPYPDVVVTNLVPVAFWQREVLWRTADRYGSARYSLLGPPAERTPAEIAGEPTSMDDPRIAGLVRGNADAEAFLFWSRMPVAQREGDAIVLRDQRFMITGLSPFSVRLEP